MKSRRGAVIAPLVLLLCAALLGAHGRQEKTSQDAKRYVAIDYDYVAPKDLRALWDGCQTVVVAHVVSRGETAAIALDRQLSGEPFTAMTPFVVEVVDVLKGTSTTAGSRITVRRSVGTAKTPEGRTVTVGGEQELPPGTDWLLFLNRSPRDDSYSVGWGPFGAAEIQDGKVGLLAVGVGKRDLGELRRELLSIR